MMYLRVLAACMLIITGCNAPSAKQHPATVNSTASSPDTSGFSEVAVLGKPVLDAGIIPKGSDSAFTFHIKCTSASIPLVIYQVQTSCICTVTHIETPKTVQPGDSLEIKAYYNTKLKGSFSQNILVFNNSARNPVMLNIRGVVK